VIVIGSEGTEKSVRLFCSLPKGTSREGSRTLKWGKFPIYSAKNAKKKGKKNATPREGRQPGAVVKNAKKRPGGLEKKSFK